MQLPDVTSMPDGGGAVSQFLDSFLRGDRDLNPRKEEGSILQALGLMNDNFIESRVKVTNLAGLSARNVGQAPATAVDNMFMNVLSRHPSATELSAAVTFLLDRATKVKIWKTCSGTCSTR